METYSYSGREDYFGLPYPLEGDLGDDRDEALKTQLIGRLFQRAFDALGAGVIEGGEASAGDQGVDITAVKAIIPDDVGCVPCEHEATTIALDQFDEGDNWIFLQLGETAREDGSCAYVVDQTSEAPARSIVIAKVTVSGGAIAGVDNTVKDVPAIAGRIPWEVLKRSYDDATTLLEFLQQALGQRYVDGTAPADVDTRLSELEQAGGGSGGSSPYWGELQKGPGDPTTIEQEIEQRIDEHVSDYHSDSAQSGNVTLVLEEFDVDAANQARMVLKLTRSVDPNLPTYLSDAVVVVWGCFGDGSGGTPDFIDRENSTWLP